MTEICECIHTDLNHDFKTLNCLLCKCKKFKPQKIPKEIKKIIRKMVKGLDKPQKGCGKYINEPIQKLCGINEYLCPKCKPQNHSQRSDKLEEPRSSDGNRLTASGTFNLSSKMWTTEEIIEDPELLTHFKWIEEEDVKEFIRILKEDHTVAGKGTIIMISVEDLNKISGDELK